RPDGTPPGESDRRTSSTRTPTPSSCSPRAPANRPVRSCSIDAKSVGAGQRRDDNAIIRYDIKLGIDSGDAVAARTVRTTLAIPAELLDAVDQAIREGKARSRNELVASALRHELAAHERAAIDAAFAAMADDPDYRAEAERIAAEFATADWEALR